MLAGLFSVNYMKFTISKPFKFLEFLAMVFRALTETNKNSQLKKDWSFLVPAMIAPALWLLGSIVRRQTLTDCNAKDVLHKLAKKAHVEPICLAKVTDVIGTESDSLWCLWLDLQSFSALSWLLMGSNTGISDVLVVWGCTRAYSSMSSSPEPCATGTLSRGESPGGLVGLRGLWGVGEGQGVWSCRHTVCLRWRCRESFSFRDTASSGGRHTTNSMQEWLLRGQEEQVSQKGGPREMINAYLEPAAPFFLFALLLCLYWDIANIAFKRCCGLALCPDWLNAKLPVATQSHLSHNPNSQQQLMVWFHNCVALRGQGPRPWCNHMLSIYCTSTIAWNP